MRQSGDQRRQFALHPSVAAQWWLRHLAESSSAVRFLEEQVATRMVRLLAPDTLDLSIVNQIASDLLRDLDIDLARWLTADIALTLQRMQTEGVLRLIAHQRLLPIAMVNVALHDVPVDDGVALALAQQGGLPLLVADRAAYDNLRRFLSIDPPVQVVWLPDQLRR